MSIPFNSTINQPVEGFPPSITHGGSSWVAGALHYTSAFLARRAEASAARQRQKKTIWALAHLDDRMLRDIGLDPADFPALRQGDLRGVTRLLLDTFFRSRS